MSAFGFANANPIAVHWREEEHRYPPARFIAQANAADPVFLSDSARSASRDTRTCLPGTPTGTPRLTPVMRPHEGRVSGPGRRDVRVAEARVTVSKDIGEKVTKAIETGSGNIARPKNVWIVPDMLKTRSGKIIRRVIAAVSNFTDEGDTTTLANPEIVEDIRYHVQSEKVARGEVPPELSSQEIEEIKAFGRAEIAARVEAPEGRVGRNPTTGVSEAVPLQSLDQVVRIELALHRGSGQSSPRSTSSGGRSRRAIAITVEREI